jgi:hypothetical protein
MNHATEFGSFLAKTMESLAARYANLPDGKRRALLAKARREMIAQSKARKP